MALRFFYGRAVLHPAQDTPQKLAVTSEIAAFVFQQDTNQLQYLPGSIPLLAFRNKLHF